MIQIDYSSFFKKRRKLKSGFPVGMILFTGKQGAGKSLSQSRYVYQLQQKYNAIVYSATDYKHADHKIDESKITEQILTKRQKRPTVFLLDEIQVLLDPATVTGTNKAQITKAIQQQRKRKTSIVGTLQVYLDIQPIYRRQIQYVVACSKIGAIQIEQWLDGETLNYDEQKNKYVGKMSHLKIWKRHNEMFDLYDTHEVVGEKNQNIIQQQQTKLGSVPM